MDLLCLSILSPTTETIYTSGLPSLTKYFGIDGGITQITSTLYFLGFALGILSFGRLLGRLWLETPIKAQSYHVSMLAFILRGCYLSLL